MRRPCNLAQVVTGWPSLAALETWAWNVQPPAPSGNASQTTAVALIGTLARPVEVEDSHFQTVYGRIDWSLYSTSRAVFPEEHPPGCISEVSRLRLDTVAHQN